MLMDAAVHAERALPGVMLTDLRARRGIRSGRARPITICDAHPANPVSALPGQILMIARRQGPLHTRHDPW